MPTRTFLALDLDETIRSRLAKMQQQLADADAAVRWTVPSQLHVTMKFLGDVADQGLPEVCRLAAEVAAGVEAFNFSVAEVLRAPAHGQIRMVWIGIVDPSGQMAKLSRLLEEAYAEIGFKAEGRRFQPHMTLGRVKGGRNVAQLCGAIVAAAQTDFGVQSASEIVVYASKLGPHGPMYTPLATCPLG
ncbi:MAG: RNA 2',3'-cyclic phosphodiesterase [Planctomycetes bacterium]|nr:RNA 2',3'-cyclic phosphodiesterase [Planctomycetota bacterium]